jgi:hypothetical protein
VYVYCPLESWIASARFETGVSHAGTTVKVAVAVGVCDAVADWLGVCDGEAVREAVEELVDVGVSVAVVDPLRVVVLVMLQRRGWVNRRSRRVAVSIGRRRRRC